MNVNIDSFSEMQLLDKIRQQADSSMRFLFDRTPLASLALGINNSAISAIMVTRHV